MSSAFLVAFRGGCVMGFALTSLGLLVLTLLITLYTNLYIEQYEDYTNMY
jgi:Na+/H+-translocating membrane pyrophosphatase